MSEKIYKILANVDQGLTEEEKHQARSNIGAIAGVNVATAGGTTPLVPDENDRVTVDLTDIEGGVPPYTSSDEGKVLGVVGSSDPELQWVTQSGGSSSVVYVTTSNTYEEVYAIYDAGKLPVLKAGTYADNQFYYVLTQVDLSSGHYLHRGVMLFTRWNGTSTNGYTYCMAGNFGIGQYACWRNGQGATQWTSNFSTILPSYSSADSGKVLTVDTNNEPAWVTPSGGSSYSEGSGISISQNNEISAKVDGSSITVNSSGELQAASQLPSYSSADSGKSLVVNGNGDGLTWDRKISGVVYNGASSSELRHIRLNTYNNPSTPGLVAAFPAGAQGVSCGFLMPDPGFVADETVDKVARIIENPNNSGVCMLEYQDDAAVISPLEKYTITTSTNPYEVDVQPGKWYEIVCSQSTAQTWNIYLEANSLVTTNTVHTIVRITRTDASVSCSPSLVWHDERGIIHYEQCDLTGTTSYYDFDCLVRKNGYTVGGIPWSFARVRRI